MANIAEHTVISGETLSKIALTYLKSAEKWTDIRLKTPAPGKTPTFAARIANNEKSSDNAPFIYPGDVLSWDIESNTEEPVTTEEKAAEPPKAGEIISWRKKEGRPFFDVRHQAPVPRLEVYTKGSADSPDFVYSGDPWRDDGKILSYTFSEAVNDLSGSFSFTIENTLLDENGKTAFDLIPIRSVVKIFEGADYPAFIGIVRRRGLSVAMTSNGPKKTITFSGKSIISLITEYIVPLDVRIQGVHDAMTETMKLKSDLALKNGLTIKKFMEDTWNHFELIAESVGLLANTGIAKIIEEFIGTLDKFLVVEGNQDVEIPIANVFYNQAENNIVNIWRNILPVSVYEMFSYCDREDGKAKIKVRETPFGEAGNGAAWKGLLGFEIDPLDLISYNLSQSDEEVYTVFASYVLGSAMSRDFYIAASQDSQKDGLMKVDADKAAVYGFKPLEIDFLGYNREMNEASKWETASVNLKAAIKKLNEKAAYWFGRLDEMYSGTITVITHFPGAAEDRKDVNPRIGCRALFLGGEFYINRAEHTWEYGGKPVINLSVSRGMIYDEDGKIGKGADGVIKNIAAPYKELGGA